MREAFNLFDKDKDGRITCSELLTVMKELRQQASEDEIKDMITHADEDGNYSALISKLIVLILVVVRGVVCRNAAERRSFKYF